MLIPGENIHSLTNLTCQNFRNFSNLVLLSGSEEQEIDFCYKKLHWHSCTILMQMIFASHQIGANPSQIRRMLLVLHGIAPFTECFPPRPDPRRYPPRRLLAVTACAVVARRSSNAMRCKRVERVALVGGTHGNELSGVHLVRSLLRQPGQFQDFGSLEIDAGNKLGIWYFVNSLMIKSLHIIWY